LLSQAKVDIGTENLGNHISVRQLDPLKGQAALANLNML
jgi:hypothetical protein